MPTPLQLGPGRSGRAASAALVRRRHLLFLLLAVGLGGVCGGILLGIRATGPWGILSIFGGAQGLDRPRNLLVVGLERADKGARGNLFMLARLDPRLDQLTLISLPAHTQTTIPGYGVAQLADAPAVGGLRLVRSAAESLLGSPIDRAIALYPSTEAAIVDAAGEVDIEAGERRLPGRIAALYAQSPAGASEAMGRVSQQQLLVFGLARQLADHPRRIARVRQILSAQASGDLDQGDVDGFARFLTSKPFLKFATLPGDAGFGGAWIPNPGRVSALLERISNPSATRGSRAPQVEILFSPLQEKAASALANALSDKGLTVVRTAPLADDEPSSVVSRQTAGRLDDVVRGLMSGVPWFLSDDPSPYSADYTITIEAAPH